MYQMLRDHAALAGLAAYLQRPFSLAVDGGESSRIVGQVVSGNYFDVLGVRPALGRFLLPEEDATPETHPVTVIGHGLWRRSFGADVNAIGKAITLNGGRYTMAAEQKNGSPAACAIPAWRAARVDPMTSLRAD